MAVRTALRLAFLLGLAGAVSIGACGCAADPSDDETAEDVGTNADAVTVPVFVRSDQVSFGRAPSNTGDQSSKVNPDFSNADQAATEIIAWIKDHPGYDKPIYLGCVHAWDYNASHTYRTNVHTLVSKIHAATHHPLLLYFEEENASHSPHPVTADHARSLRTLAQSATLLCATYANGQDSHADVIDKVMHYRTYYHDQLGIPMTSMMIDVDTSQTPSNFYYGSLDNLAHFDSVVVWALNSAYAHGFAGFHTFGNVGGKYGTKRAADSTYAALDKAWKALVAAHPKQQFSGI
jgi:hypothetical protein